jgi:hypothetical protein
MDCEPDAQPTDHALRVTGDVYAELVFTLRSTLRLLPDDGTPEETARRDNAAIGQAAAMLPANADEANIAANCVATRLYAMDCIRRARELETVDRTWAGKCGAQAVSMLRESRQARSLLARLQAAREKRERDPVATDRAAWSEHCTIGLMTGELAKAEPPPSPPPPPEPAVDATEPTSDPAAEAEFYAIHYPRRARLIRRLGRLPDKVDFGPPPPEVVHAIVTGTTPHLLALDAEEMAAAG